jgi:hypothetical protein
MEAAQTAAPNQKVSSTTTRVDVDETAQAAKPLPPGSVIDVQKHQQAINDAKQMRALADKIEGNPESWKRLQGAERRQVREEGIKNFPAVGKFIVGAGQTIDQALGIGGPSVETKLLSEDDRTGAEISGGLNEYIVKSAKALDPESVLRAEEIQQRRDQIGLQTNDAKSMAARIRKEAEALEQRARAMEQVRSLPRP